MALVGNGGDISRERMKKEIVSEIRHEERKRKAIGCLGWLLIKLGIFAVFVLMVAVAVAKTGLYEVPVLTGWLYGDSIPIRAIQPIVGYDSDEMMQNAMSRAEYNAAVGLFSINLTEQELTTIVTTATSGDEGVSGFDVKSMQMAVTAEGIEVFAVIVRPEREITLKTLIVPLIVEDKLVLDAKSLEIGSLKIPGFLVSSVSKIVSGKLTDPSAILSSGLGDLKEIRTEDKELFLVFKPQLKLPF